MNLLKCTLSKFVPTIGIAISCFVIHGMMNDIEISQKETATIITRQGKSDLDIRYPSGNRSFTYSEKDIKSCKGMWSNTTQVLNVNCKEKDIYPPNFPTL